MKVVILCGGKGTRMREETEYRPKPLVLVGGKPILWHIMKFYASYGHKDFILCVGYKGDMIKEYFLDMHWRHNDFTIHLGESGGIEYHTGELDDWNVTIADTGPETQTGGRLLMASRYISDDEFMFTYGDGLSDVDLNALVRHHRKMGKAATLTGVHPVSTYGLMDVEGGAVTAFREKPVLKDLINGGYMVPTKRVFDYFTEPDCPFEEGPLEGLAAGGDLAVYEHMGFWKAIDTHKDIIAVDKMCLEGDMPWKRW